MTVKNYDIGGSVLARRRGDYDGCYTDLGAFRDDLKSGSLDTSKTYLVRDGLYYRVPIIDLYNTSGISAQLNPELFADPGEGTRVHPNAEGHRRLALTVSAALTALRG